MRDHDATTDAGPPTPAGEEISARTVGLGIAWNTLASVLPQVLIVVQSLVVARTLGASEQGVQSFIIFVAVTAQVSLALGLPLALQRTVSERLGSGSTGEVNYALRWGQSVAIAPAMVAAAVTWAVGRFVYTDYADAWLWATGYALFGTMHSVSSQSLLGLRQYRSASVIGLGLQLLTVPIIVIWLVSGAGVTEIVAVVAVASALSAAATMLLLRRTIVRQGLSGEVDRTHRRSTRRHIAAFAVGGGVLVILDTVVNQRSELFFLAAFHEDRPDQIAYFSVAFAAAQAAYRVQKALIMVVLPTVTALLAAGQTQVVRDGYLQGQLVLLTTSSIAVGALMGCGLPLVTLLWGADYAPAGRALLIMAVFPVMFGAMGAVATSTLLGAGKLRPVLLAHAGGAGATLGLDLLLIKPFAIYGAAAAYGLGLLISTFLLTLTTRLTLHFAHPSAADFVRHIAFACGIAGPGLISLTLDVAPIVQLGIGGVGGVLGLLCLYPALRPLAITDTQVLHRALTRMPAPIRTWMLTGVRRNDRGHRTTSSTHHEDGGQGKRPMGSQHTAGQTDNEEDYT